MDEKAPPSMLTWVDTILCVAATVREKVITAESPPSVLPAAGLVSVTVGGVAALEASFLIVTFTIRSMTRASSYTLNTSVSAPFGRAVTSHVPDHSLVEPIFVMRCRVSGSLMR